FNEQAGWMHTSSGIDNVDEFAEQTALTRFGRFYVYGKDVRPYRTKPITLAYRLPDGTLASRSFTTYASHHGPIVAE
ncbi:penicillin acylase family protein, partial [Acinetobacter baumannii]